MALEPGTILGGKYRVEGVIGRGGMGIVLSATHLTLHKLVALKIMRPDLAVDADAAQRFVREARAASQLRSEHVARVIDLDTLPDGAPYIAMEYLDGEDLGAALARRGNIPVHEAAIYIAQVCDAIGEAHAAGIVHRDLKPANLFLTHRARTPCIKVLDFGISKILAGGALADDIANTDTRAIVGSPQYMAPEQLLSAKAVDPRTDIWALGCILFELVSGTSPFTGDAIAHVMASILRDNAPLLETNADIPADFLAVIERCLQKDPAQRFQRVEDLLAALEPFTTPAPSIATMRTPEHRFPSLTTANTCPPRPRPSMRSVGIALGTMLVLVVAVLFTMQHLTHEDSAIAQPAIDVPSRPAIAVSSPPAIVPSPPAIVPPATPVSITPTPVPAARARPRPTTKTKANAKAKAKPPTRSMSARPILEADLIGPSFE